MISPTGDCFAGYYCTLASPKPNPLSKLYGGICPLGYYCPIGTHTPYACPAGTFRNTTGGQLINDCILCTPGSYCEGSGLSEISGECEAGFYCSFGANVSYPSDGLTGDICPIGHYCPEGSAMPRSCEDGTYANVSGTDSCLGCPVGFFCPAMTIEPHVCSPGFYCPSGTGLDLRPCPRGTYSPHSGLGQSEQCTPCTGGSYCAYENGTTETGLCSPGYYCEIGVDTPTPAGMHTGVGGLCPEGHYCPMGSTHPLGCPAGTYQDLIGQPSCEECPAGYYCLANSTTFLDTPCPPGYYCPNGTTHSYQFPCPAGTFNNYSLAGDILDCQLCLPGMYCGGEGIIEPSGLCSEGYFCSVGSISRTPTLLVRDSLVFSACPPYSTNDTGGICPIGYFCPPGSHGPSPCLPGMYCPYEGLNSPFAECSAGYYCPQGASIPDFIPCSPGHYCPDGSPIEIECPPGTFSGTFLNTNESDCSQCTAGYYCEGYGNPAPTDTCDKGYYCPGGQDTATPTNYACSPGHFCEAGSSNQTGCPPGEYQPNWAQGDCLVCPASYYCDPTELSCTLDVNYTLICQINKTLDTSDLYVSIRGVMTPTLCQPGSYCPNGTEFSTQYLCPPGTYSNSSGLWKESQCTPCPPRMYCSSEGLTKPDGLCSPGYYCSLGANTSSPTDGLTGGTCPLGHYCVAGSTLNETPCPIGTFNNQTGITSKAECQGCTPGSYCPRTGLSEPVGPCAPGHFCLTGSSVINPINESFGDLCPSGSYCYEGTSTPQQCPQGTFLPSPGGYSPLSCIPCSVGVYCESAGQSSNTSLCSPGYYCIEGATTPAPTDGITGDICPEAHHCPLGSHHPFPCPNGTYTNHTGAESCYRCPEGYYCPPGSIEPTPCPEGYFCPPGTDLDWQACPIGTYGARKGLSSLEECTICPGGFYCATPGSLNVTGPCESGYYCTSGVTTSTPNGLPEHGNGSVCMIGHYCPENTITPLPCPPGTYNLLLQQPSCFTCPAGYFCLSGTIDFSDHPCPTGHYCLNGTTFSYEYPCPPGANNPYIASTGIDSCLPCPPGQYCEGDGNTHPTGNCSEGYYCISGSHTPTPNPYSNITLDNGNLCEDTSVIGGRCYPGSYCPSASAVPIPCTPGMYCGDYNLATPQGPCFPGFFCSGGDFTSQPVDKFCPMGHYCRGGSQYPVPCPMGTFLNTTGNMDETDCEPCPEGFVCNRYGLTLPVLHCSPGYYCPPGQNSTTPPDFTCPVGYHCPLGSSIPIGCPSGTHQDVPLQSECKVCPAGYFCDALLASFIFTTSGHGVVVPFQCPIGYYCPNGTEYASQYPCPIGTFSSSSGVTTQEECIPCTPGSVCTEYGLTEPNGVCSPGYYCTLGASTPAPTDGVSGDICPRGYFCETASFVGSLCPAGTFSNATGLKNETQCTPCTPGMYCPSSANLGPVGPCSAGYYCTGGATEPSPSLQSYGSYCPRGHYCPTGSEQPIACSIGSYLPTTHSKVQSDCINCAPGYFCAKSGLSEVQGPCNPGFYCLGGAFTSQPSDGITGDVCPLGHYCPNATDTPYTCREGTYANVSGTDSCLGCPVGFFCPAMTIEPHVCSPGFYCPSGTGLDLRPCPRGTYSPHSGLGQSEQCTPCTGGSYCAYENGTTETGLCSPGYYCEIGVDTPTPAGMHTGVGGLCPEGHYCPMGSTHPLGCPAGTYQDLIGQPSCEECPAGYYCLANSTTFLDTPCPPGYYCPNGTTHSYQFPCPAGSYNPSNGSDGVEGCSLCPQRMYCEGEGQPLPTGFCSSGFYCFLGSTSSSPIPIITDTVLANYSNTCPYLVDVLMGDVCPEGTYCPLGSYQPIPCPSGRYCDLEGLTTPTGNCSAGFYCSEGSMQSDQQPCSPGHFCPKGTPREIECPPGTFSNVSGNADEDNCLPCTPGYYCNDRALTAPTGECTQGYYCPGGQTEATPSQFICKPGHFCVRGSLSEVGCGPGTYQDSYGSLSCVTCPDGYYCDPFEFANISIYFNNITSLEGVSMPSVCPAGFYCPAGTKRANEFPCPPGTYSNSTGLNNDLQCTDCLSRMFCGEPALTAPTGPCDAGYVCVFGASSPTPSDNRTGGPCPLGRYCVEGSSTGELCPIGTFNNRLGLSSIHECQQCSPGMYCASAGLKDPTGNCSAGHFCRGGSPISNPINESYGYLCPPGHYCPQGTPSPVPCTIGTFRMSDSSQSVEDCESCLPGGYCPIAGSTDVFEECSPGYYCIESATTPAPTDGVTGDICPEAHHCPLGSHHPFPCPNGTYMNHTGAESCYGCPEGYYCPPGSIEPTLCPRGYFCPPGTDLDWQACPAGTYGTKTGLTGEDECTPCSPGYYCDSSGLRSPTGVCHAAFYCTIGINTPEPGGNHSGVGGICPTGHYCPQNSSHPIECLAGTFNPYFGQASCFVCPAGFYCGATSTDLSNSSCPGGHYCPEGTKFDMQYPCPSGTYNSFTGAHNISACEACPPGMYCEGSGLSSPTGVCSPGYYCVSGSSSSTPIPILNGSLSLECSLTDIRAPGSICWPGTFCPVGSELPTACTRGMYCDGFGLDYPTGPCNAGYYCNGSASMPGPPDSICPPGHYCTNGSSVPMPCPRGTFSPTIGNPNVSYCQPCLPGYFCGGTGLDVPEGECLEGHYCPLGQENSSPQEYTCPPGYYCPNGSDLPMPCERGSYQASWRQLECQICPSGYFCDPTNSSGVVSLPVLPGVIAPEVCPTGHYCPAHTEYSTQYPCPSGTYNNLTSLHRVSQCTLCEPGMYCGDEGLAFPSGPCSPGFYCILGAITPQPLDGFTGDVCPMGEFCPDGSQYGIPCPQGTFNNATGIQSERGCKECSPGYYCYSPGLEEPSGPCSSGHYCVGGAIHPDPFNVTQGGGVCPSGSYCPEGSATPQVCPIGTFQPNKGAQNYSECIRCSPGMFCDSQGLVSPSGDCQAGYYCIEGAVFPAPTDNLTGNVCPIGSFCPTGSVSPTQCTNGTYTNHTGALECYPCSVGQYCAGGSHSEPCPQGYYCLEGTAVDWTPCPEGTYGDLSGLGIEADCKQCDEGAYCSGTGQVTISGLCSPGYYCQEGVNVSQPSAINPHTGIGDVCTPGHYCPIGSPQPIPCESGTYSPSEAQSNCTLCPRGQYCPFWSVQGLLCPPGYFCPPGTGSYLQYPCPAGTFNNHTGATSLYECTPCPGGEYCPTAGLSVPYGPCEAGVYCLSGSTTASPFSIGINSSLLCDAEVETCLCSGNLTNGGICPKGYYCPVGSALPSSCPAGMYCPYEMLSAPFDICHPGYFCNGSSDTPEQFPCPAGHYCGEGSEFAIPCPLGTFSETRLNQDSSSCEDCSPGMYCNELGITEPSGNCSEGYFCPGNSSSQVSPTPTNNACPRGHFCPEGSSLPRLCYAGTYQPLEQQPECLMCPAGLYCDPGDGVQAVIVPQECPEGYYCPPGTGSVFEPCPAGTFSNKSNLQSEEDCTECWPGLYCEGTALTEPSGPCFAGYFCTGGASSSTPSNFTLTISGNDSSMVWNGNGECPIGYFCQEESRVPMPCPVGTFSQSRGVINVSGCEPCPRGRYCDFTGPVMVSEAPPCAAGFVCTGGSPNPTPGIHSIHGFPCPPGFFCKEGTLFEEPCPPGEYQPDMAQGSCLLCPSGMSCPLFNMTLPLPCLIGYYCPENTSLAEPCPQGTFTKRTNLTHMLECTYCEAGKYCGEHGLSEPSGDCAAGYYCHSGAFNPVPNLDPMFPLNGPCPAGSYCPAGTINPLSCAEGTFRDTTGAANESECHPCTPGYHCNTTNLTAPSGKCAPGYYCPGGVEDRHPLGFTCPSGFYCPEGSSLPSPCPPSFYQQFEMQDHCEICPMGRICIEATIKPADCPQHHYCPLGTGLNPSTCPPGTYTPDSLVGLSHPAQCLPCPAGSYCRNGVISGSCSAGYFCLSANPIPSPSTSFDYSILDNQCDTPISPVCEFLTENHTIVCQTNYTLIENVTTLNESLLTCDTIYSCDEAPFMSCTEFSDLCHSDPNDPMAVLCNRYFVCASVLNDSECSVQNKSCLLNEPPDLTACEAISSYISESYNASSLDELGFNVSEFNKNFTYTCDLITPYPVLGGYCRPSHYCPEGISEPIPCPEGTYNPEEGGSQLSDCIACPAGYKCVSGDPVPKPCPAGHYCPLDSVGIPCPLGTYRNSVSGHTLSNCYNCPAGFWCNDTGIANYSSYPCPPGHYCLERTIAPVICPSGTHRNESGGESVGGCSPCQGGYHCPARNCLPQEPLEDGSNSSYVVNMKDFSFVGQNMSNNVTEPELTYDYSNITCPNICQCDISLTIDSHIHGIPCRAGYYCPIGSPGELLCPGGYICVARSETSDPCQAGYFCPPGSEFEMRCEYPFYCPPISAEPQPCPGGYVARNISLYEDLLRVSQNDSCLLCEEGFYTNDGIMCFECPEGYYCPIGTSNPLENPCPVGHYCPPGSASAVSCKRGTYNPERRSVNESDCIPCLGNAFNNQRGMPN